MSASSVSCRFLPEGFAGRALVWSQGLGSSDLWKRVRVLAGTHSWRCHAGAVSPCHPPLPAQGEAPRQGGISRRCHCDAKGLFAFLPGTVGSDHGVPVPVGVPGHAGTWQSLLMSLAVPQGSVLFPGWLLSLPLCPAALPQRPPHPHPGV